MNKHLIKWSLFALTSFVFACDKTDDDGTTAPVTTYPDFARLQVGNYWVYERFTIDTDNVATSQNIFDSCYIEKDTLVNGLIYHKMIRPVYSTANNPDSVYLLRDSLHYVVTSSGYIIFSSVDFSSVFDTGNYIFNTSDTIYEWDFKMHGPPESVTVPAGTYLTINARRTYHIWPNWSVNESERSLHNRYALNMGIVVESLPFFAASPNYFERRLVRYHFN